MGINLQVSDLIYPYFVIEGRNRKEPVSSMPGIFKLSIDNLIKDIEETRGLGINKMLLFGVSGEKDNKGSGASSKNGIVQKAIREIKGKIRENKGKIKDNKGKIRGSSGVEDIVVISDVCLCGYTTHGHCGILNGQGSGVKGQGSPIDNRKTLKALARIALSHAEAGADYVAPSAMAKKQVLAIRKALDKNGFKRVKIMGYSAKFASNFYGPFRNAAISAPRFGDRSAYQLDYRDRDRAIKEIKDDIAEGADIVMVKPALGYLDLIKEASLRFKRPLAAYNVSGEYAMVKFGAKNGLWDEKKMVFEILTSIKRAGAGLIISYHAKDAARWIRE
jgi:porphobilinogen synthase